MQQFSIAFTFILFMVLGILLNEIDAKNKFKFKIKNKVKFGDTHSHSHEHWHDHGHNSGSNFNECEAEYKSEDWRGNKEEIEEGKVICPIGVNTCVKFKCDTIGFKYKYKGCGTCSDVYFELAKNGKTRFELDRLGCTCEGSYAKIKNSSFKNGSFGPIVSILLLAIGVFASFMLVRT